MMNFEHCFSVEVPLPPYREINGGRGSRPFYPQTPKVCQQDTADVGRGGRGMTEKENNLVLSWLQRIEASPDEISEVQRRCATSIDAQQYFLMRAMDG